MMEKRVKLLIVNDSPEFHGSYGRIFENSGMEVSYVPKDGVKLLEKIQETSPDVVLTNLFMPRLDGIGVMKAFHAKSPGSHPLFVIVSNFTSPTLEREVMMSGAAYFAVAPFDAADLADRILQLCSISGLKVQNSPVQAKGSAEPSLEIQVTEILHQIGVPAHIKGYHYLRDSIIMAIENPDIINAVTSSFIPAWPGATTRRPRGWSAPSATRLKSPGTAATWTFSIPISATPFTTPAANRRTANLSP